MPLWPEPGGRLQVEFADVSDVGHRDENQDRAAVVADANAALLITIDGMGGHYDGAQAAEIGRATLLGAFAAETHPLFDPLGFLHLSLGRAHEAVVEAGQALPVDQRPRATCAVCLVQDGAAYWAHLGDARVYHIRNGVVLRRTRDHSHVESLLRDGVIREDEVQGTAEERVKQIAGGAFARIRQQAEVGLIGDAVYDQAFYRAVVRAIGSELELPAGAGQIRFVPGADFAELTAELPEALGKMLRALSELYGGREVLDLAQAALVVAPDEVHAPLDDLMAIADALSLRYAELPLYFELGELRGYHYHTGVVFAAFVPGVGYAIAQGGRYDDIGADFGRARPATGFSTDLKTLVSLGQMQLDEVVGGVWAPDNHDVFLWQAIQRLR